MSELHDRQEGLKREALAWLTRIGLGNATEDDLAALRQWRDRSPAHAAALARAGQLWRELGPPVDALVRAGVTLPAGDDRRHRLTRRAMLGGAVAAGAAAGTFLLLDPPLHLWPSAAELAADYRTGTGEQRHLAVSDAVSIEMNTQTSLSTRSAIEGAGMELISGEAAVTVVGTVLEAARPFVVIAANGRIVARAATFNLRRDGGVVCVTCIDGAVTVEGDQGRLSIGRAQQVSYGAQGLGAVVAADPAEVIAWRDGMLVFHDAPLARVIDEVNRYRPGRIILLDAALGRRLVTARFEISRLDTVMGQISHVFRAPVKTLPGGFVLVG